MFAETAMLLMVEGPSPGKRIFMEKQRTRLNIADKPVWQSCFLIEITLVAVLNLEKPFDSAGCPALAYHVVNRFPVQVGVVY